MIVIDNKIKIGDWIFIPSTHQLESKSNSCMLENRQAQLLLFLTQNAGRNVTKTELLQLWHPRVVNEDALYVGIAGLRKALGDDTRSPKYIKTLPGLGYRLVAPVTELTSTKPFQTRQYPWKLGAVAMVLCVVALYWVWQERELRAETKIPAAVADDFRRGRYLLNQNGEHYVAGMDLLRSIMQREPTFADSYALAAYHQGRRLLGADEQSLADVKAWIAQALSLSPNHPVAHLAKANMLFLVQWDIQAAREHFEQALGNADSHLDYAIYLLAVGDLEQALASVHQYQDMKPEGYSLTSVAWIQTMAGEYEAALNSINKLHSLEPDNFFYHVSRQAILELQGNDSLAFEDLRWLMSKTGYADNHIHATQLAFDQDGLPGVYAWLLNEDPQHLNLGQYLPPLSLARYAIGAGHHEQALAFLQQAVDARQFEVLWLAVDPKYRPLHGHPDFAALLNKIGLPEAPAP